MRCPNDGIGARVVIVATDGGVYAGRSSLHRTREVYISSTSVLSLLSHVTSPISYSDFALSLFRTANNPVGHLGTCRLLQIHSMDACPR